MGVDDQHGLSGHGIGQRHSTSPCAPESGRATAASDMTLASFPAVRLRRSRATQWSRSLVAETVLNASDLIWPLFVTEGRGVEEPIATLPGVSRWSVDRLVERARDARNLGIPCIALFPNTPLTLRSEEHTSELQSLM